MSVGYKLAYRVGLTPWEKAGVGFGPQLSSLLDREQADATLPLGKALDIGCGTGDHAIELARRGWQVTGVDYVAQALDKARDKATAAGVAIEYVEADATRLADSVGNGYQLLLDVGCLHGFKPDQREDYARGAAAVTARGGVLLLFAFGPGRRGPLPRGLSRDELLATFVGWDLTHDEAANTEGMPGPLKKSEPRWYRMIRRD
jgi:SAM-dependent methyltransferase